VLCAGLLVGTLGATEVEAQVWSQRWEQGERQLGDEVDLTAVRVTLFGSLVLVSQPYVPSDCGENQPYEGQVAAFDRENGALRWTRTIHQTSGDQAAYLRSHTTHSRIVFETWGHMRAFDARGSVVWTRENGAQTTCARGPGAGPSEEVRRRGRQLEWSEASHACRLNLRTGLVAVGPAVRAAGAARARSLYGCVGRESTEGLLLGGDCDARGRAWVVAEPAPSGERYRLVVRYRRRRR